MLFEELAGYFKAIEKVSSRIQMREQLLELFNKLTSEERQIVSYFLQGRLVPPYISLEFNLADRSISRLLVELFNIDDARLKKLQLKYKDLAGAYAYLKERDRGISKGANAKELSITELYELLGNLALLSGVGSQEEKLKVLTNLLRAVSGEEGKYIIRLITGRLRLGISVRSILDALSVHAAQMDKMGLKNIKQLFDKAYAISSDIGYITDLYFRKGITGIKDVRFVPGIPIAPQLAEREKTIEACIKRISEPMVDPKFDGLRAQIHIFDKRLLQDATMYQSRVWFKFYKVLLEKKQAQVSILNSQKNTYVVKIFSRNLEDITHVFPEVHEWAIQYADELFSGLDKGKPRVIVFDSEAIGYNESVGEFYGFQVTMRRRRKYGIEEFTSKIPIKAFVFDVLVFGEEILGYSQLERRSLLEQLFKDHTEEETVVLNEAHLFVMHEVPRLSTWRRTVVHVHEDILKEVKKEFYDYVSRGLEGVLFKDINAPYEAGLRRFNWIKFKRAMKQELADTFDLVVLGYYFGKGRLAKLGIGGLLMGVYDKRNDNFLTITKVGTGFTDDMWRYLRNLLDKRKLDKPLYNVKVAKELVPDVWVYPDIVLEIEADEITKSPLHTSGYALRFPRFKRVREDKSPQEATSLEEVNEMANS